MTPPLRAATSDTNTNTPHNSKWVACFQRWRLASHSVAAPTKDATKFSPTRTGAMGSSNISSTPMVPAISITAQPATRTRLRVMASS